MAASSNIKKILTFQIFLDRKLGEGAYGIVYLAKNTFTSEQVACKVTKFANLREKAEVEQEIHILDQLRDIDGVIKYHGSYIDEKAGEAYLFMQQMDDTFENFLKEPEHLVAPLEISEIKSGGRLPEGEALFYFHQLLKTLRDIHGKGLMHRDLKPDNLFMQGDKLYLGDFNLSKFAQMTHSVVGTPMYMCPLIVIEKLGGFGHYVDLWSAGHILFRILVGFHYYEYMKVKRRLKSVEEYVRVMSNKLEDEGIIFPSEIPISVGTKDLIRKLLDKQLIKNLSASQLLEDPIFAKYKKKDEERMRKSSTMMVRSSLTKSLFGFDEGMGTASNIKWTKALFESLSSKVEYLQELRTKIGEFKSDMEELIAQEPNQATAYKTILAHTQYLHVLTGAMLIYACRDFCDTSNNYEAFQRHAISFKKKITDLEFYQLIKSLEEDGTQKALEMDQKIPELTKELLRLTQGLQGLSKNKKDLLDIGLDHKHQLYHAFPKSALKVLKDYRLFLCENYDRLLSEYLKPHVCYVAELSEQLAVQEAKPRLTVWSRVAVAVLHADLHLLQQKVLGAVEHKDNSGQGAADQPGLALQYLVYLLVVVLLLGGGFVALKAFNR